MSHRHPAFAAGPCCRAWKLLALLVLAGSAAAQPAFQPAGENWLPWTAAYSYERGREQRCGIDRALLGRWTATLQRLATVWSQTPGATGPALYGRMQGVLSMDACQGRLQGALVYWPWPEKNLVARPVPGQPGQTRLEPSGETSALAIQVNQLAGIEPVRQLNGEDGLGPVMGTLQPVKRRFGGYPVFADRTLLITSPGRPPFMAVSLDDALQAWLKYSPRGDGGLPRARALRDSLDDAGRRAPAYVRRDPNTGNDEIVATPDAGAQAIVRYNPSYFDERAPRHLAQALAVEVHLIDLVPPIDDPRLSRKLARRMLEATDWPRMAAELMR